MVTNPHVTESGKVTLRIWHVSYVLVTLDQRLKRAVMANELEFADEQFALLNRSCRGGGGLCTLETLGWRTFVLAYLAVARYQLARGRPEQPLQAIAHIQKRPS